MTRNNERLRTRSASDGPGVCATAVSAVAGRRTLNQRTGTTAQRAVAHGPALALGVRTNSVRSLTVAGLLGAGGGVRELALAARKRRVPFFLRACVSGFCVSAFCVSAFCASAFCVSVFCVSPALAQSNDGYVIKKTTIDGGGHTFHEGGGYRLGGTVGQHDAGDHAGGGYVLTGGFWTPGAPPPLGACCDHDPFGGCQDDRALDECVCGKCEWFQERTCAQIDCTREAIPTVSEWGLVILTLLLLTGAKIYFGRPKVAGLGCHCCVSSGDSSGQRQKHCSQSSGTVQSTISIIVRRGFG